VKLKSLEAASESFDQALQLAKSQKDRAAENAIRRAIDDINSTVAKRALKGSDSDRASQSTRGTLRNYRRVCVVIVVVEHF